MNLKGKCNLDLKKKKFCEALMKWLFNCDVKYVEIFEVEEYF